MKLASLAFCKVFDMLKCLFLGRDIIPALESWDIDPVMWIFEATGEDLRKHGETVDSIVDARCVFGQQVSFFRAVAATKSSISAEQTSILKDNRFSSLHKSLEDRY